MNVGDTQSTIMAAAMQLMRFLHNRIICISLELHISHIKACYVSTWLPQIRDKSADNDTSR